MKKAFLIHGFQGRPNGGWRPWLMSELAKLDVYAAALAMPNSDHPKVEQWVEEISRAVEASKDDEIYLVGHSLGTPAILRYLEKLSPDTKIAGSILVSGPSEKTDEDAINNFFETPFDFPTIKFRCNKFVIIHGDNDPAVPLDQGKFLSKELGGELVIIENGGHLNGEAGWFELPQALDAIKKML